MSGLFQRLVSTPQDTGVVMPRPVQRYGQVDAVATMDPTPGVDGSPQERSGGLDPGLVGRSGPIVAPPLRAHENVTDDPAMQDPRPSLDLLRGDRVTRTLGQEQWPVDPHDTIRAPRTMELLDRHTASTDAQLSDTASEGSFSNDVRSRPQEGTSFPHGPDLSRQDATRGSRTNDAPAGSSDPAASFHRTSFAEMERAEIRRRPDAPLFMERDHSASTIGGGSAAPGQEVPTAPVIEISIGHIEVRAPQPPQRQVAPARFKPAMGLEEYMQRRNQGRS